MNGLEEQVRLVHQGQTSRVELYRLLLGGQLIVPVDRPVQEAATGQTPVKVLCAMDHEGYLSTGLFTSEKALSKWSVRPCNFIQATGLQVFRMLTDMPVQRAYVNWAAEHFVVLGRWEIQALSRGEAMIGPTETFDLPNLEEVNVSRPKVTVPPELTGSLRRLIEADPRIAFAYLPQIRYGRGQPREGALVLVLVPRKGLPEPVVEEATNSIGDQAQDLLPMGETMDIMTLPPEHELLSLVMRTGAILVVNDINYHERILATLQRFWDLSA